MSGERLEVVCIVPMSGGTGTSGERQRDHKHTTSSRIPVSTVHTQPNPDQRLDNATLPVDDWRRDKTRKDASLASSTLPKAQYVTPAVKFTAAVVLLLDVSNVNFLCTSLVVRGCC